ncbi:transglutaminase family protein [Nocardia panacis]|uniref:Transglutaminase family protein n=1 Tax=Nocardia panacis TaxID=2340916 RepID=A0A3A4KWL4_9NOCA|nr:transglutaminase family protein [Nocardia panacis]RJO77974.1 transglutaminase family protein [Nocardia panacis]
MGIKVSLEHRTTYTFDRVVRVHPHVVRLRPAPHARTKIEGYSLRVAPERHFINWQQDAFGNFLARLVFPESAREVSITVGLIADLEAVNPFDFFVEEDAERFPFEYAPGLATDLEAYLRPVSGAGALVADWVRVNTPVGRPRTIDVLVELNRALRSAVEYTIRLEPGVQSPEHTLRTGLGSCRDTAWLLVAVLRAFGVAARFVSGYLVQLAQDVPSLDGPSGPAADFTDLHAWAEAYLPGAGWVGLDPTSGLFAGEGHIPLAATPHPASSAPIAGATEPTCATLDFANVVRRIHEDPRVTLPYSAAQWAQIEAVGAAVDALAARADIGLTVGGEPTFVAIDERDRPEWTTEADGPHKRARAADLAERLRREYAPNGIVQYRQGKWYPGEPLPRWEIAILWRADGAPVWSDRRLLVDPWSGAGDTDPDAARAFALRLAADFGLPSTQVRPAYEDALLRLAAKLRLPHGDPTPDELEEDSERARAELLARLDAPTRTPAAYVLPLHRRADGRGWASADWRLRRGRSRNRPEGRIVLSEGDSPAGLRLPLDAVSWRRPAPLPERDPFDPASRTEHPDEPPARVEPAPRRPPTALVTEVRNGRLHIFLPPLTEPSDFLDLVARVERAAATLGTPVALEGYAPPLDTGLRTFSITPDPGVIEVNVQPCASFAEQTAQLETLYEQARSARLATETFEVDGTHSGTGGGNHITLGGITPARSPLLRRPDLLVSLLTYWQRHPALSYFFAGRFIGATSQAPRVDEGREEALYELEIAFAEIDRLTAGGRGRPWHVDRALRHLLTDVTGNTHRAEFCIDKLYRPESARGRQGLLELRGFEMPPHHRMAAAQALLVRGLVAMLWHNPLRANLIRHGPNLHGRYLLPHFLLADLAEVLTDLRAAGIDFEPNWLDPFTEFRFPRIGAVVYGTVEIELRAAIEPWNTLGEQTIATGSARYVDSSVERLQVRVIGADPGRYLLTCNGWPVPLLATERADVQVAGVRYRAWRPPNALHPTITVDAPLVFDLLDPQSGLSRGGCTYHVSHPGGLAYDRSPVNAVEAQSRRIRRFEPAGHTVGRVDTRQLRAKLAAQSTDVGAPGILDLRRARTVWAGRIEFADGAGRIEFADCAGQVGFADGAGQVGFADGADQVGGADPAGQVGSADDAAFVERLEQRK